MNQHQRSIIVLVMVFLFSFSYVIAQSQSQMNQEEESNYKKAETELNSVYQQILKEYASDSVFIYHLKAAERLWIKFRDAELLMKYPPHDGGYYGSVLPMCQASYLEQLTLDRIKTLKVWVNGIEEGDVCSGSVKNK